jgi:uncharacterized membrane protein YGL010W
MVPAIVWSLMVVLDMVDLFAIGGTTVTVAMVIVAFLLVWYLLLDFALGVAATAVFTVLLVSAIYLNETVSTATSLWAAGGVFVASWVFQFIGHGVWEKRRPALMDNLFQVFVAPIFLVAETAFAWGFKKDLQAEVDTVMQGHLPKGTAAATT